MNGPVPTHSRAMRRAAPGRPAAPSGDGAPYPVREEFQ